LQARDAEDVLQEVFLTVARRAADFHCDREGDSFRGWLWTITRHKLGDWLRRQKHRERTAAGSEGNLIFLEAAVEMESESTDPAEVSALFQRALDIIRVEFEERSWRAFWRVTVESQDPADVATDLKMTRNAVYVAKSRILRRLREVLGEE
jgi:RNA polymerase sigma-70 factor (ECF subfamily)